MTTPAPKKNVVITLRNPIPKPIRRPVSKEVTLTLAVLTGKAGLPWLPGDILCPAGTAALAANGKIFALAFYCTHLCGEGRKKCCWCGDKRPIQRGYQMYVDGKGYLPRARRSEYYCPTCKNASLTVIKAIIS